MRTGHKTQGVALFTRMGDRFSTWDVSNGLQSIIPTLLTSSVAGYPFCLPDMIGALAWHGLAVRALAHVVRHQISGNVSHSKPCPIMTPGPVGIMCCHG